MDETSTEASIRRYYGLFNERRLEDAAAMVSADAVLDQMLVARQQRGPAGYLEFARAWLKAFPDAVLTVQHVSSADEVTHHVDLLASGTHLGELDLGGRVFKPHGGGGTLQLRETLQFQDGKIVFASMSFDVYDLIRQLAKVDTAKLLYHLERLSTLTDELAHVPPDDDSRARDVIDRIGLELDAARQTARPYFR